MSRDLILPTAVLVVAACLAGLAAAGSFDCFRVLLQINLYLHAVLRGIK